MNPPRYQTGILPETCQDCVFYGHETNSGLFDPYGQYCWLEIIARSTVEFGRRRFYGKDWQVVLACPIHTLTREQAIQKLIRSWPPNPVGKSV